MKVKDFAEILNHCDPESRLILSNDPQLLGTDSESFPEELCPTITNVSISGRYVVIWPDRLMGEKEPWRDPETIDKTPGKILKMEMEEMDISFLKAKDSEL